MTTRRKAFAVLKIGVTSAVLTAALALLISVILSVKNHLITPSAPWFFKLSAMLSVVSTWAFIGLATGVVFAIALTWTRSQERFSISRTRGALTGFLAGIIIGLALRFIVTPDLYSGGVMESLVIPLTFWGGLGAAISSTILAVARRGQLPSGAEEQRSLDASSKLEPGEV